MADDNDWRAQRAAKLIGTPFERPRETPRSRVDDTLPIQRGMVPEPVSPSAARPQGETNPYGSKSQHASKPMPAATPKSPLALRGWAIAAALVAVLVGTMAYLFSSGLNGPVRDQTVTGQPSAAVAVAAPAVRPAAPLAGPARQQAVSAASQLASAPIASPTITAEATAPERADLAVGPKMVPTAIAPATAPARTARSVETKPVERSQVARVERNMDGGKHGAIATDRRAAVLERNAVSDRRSALADRRPAIVQRSEPPANTVFATARKPATVAPLPPCDLTNRAEAAVCASPALSALRRQVHDMYVGVGTDGDPKLIAKAQREQASFLKRRDRCKDNACFNRQYTHQIEALQKFRTKAAAARVRAAAKALPACASGQRPSPGVCRPAHHRISLKKLFGIKH